MYCSSCGSQLPQGAKSCPNCGTLTPDSSSNVYSSSISAASYGNSLPPTFYGARPPLPPTIPYGSNPYDISLRDPYTMPSPPPPPRRKRLGILVATALLTLVLVAGGVFALLSHTTSAKPTPSRLTSAQVNATATATIIAGNPNPYPPGGGTLTIYDPLTTYNPAYGWDHVPGVNGANCTFNGKSYHVIEAQTGQIYICNPEGPDGKRYNFKNFAFEVQMRILKGNGGGVDFRGSGTTGYSFLLEVDGTYQLLAYANSTSNPKVLSKGNLQNFNPYNNNMIGVVAAGNNIDLYVNLQSVGSEVADRDRTSSSGNIGLDADATSQPADVAFTNVKVWAL